MSILVVNAGSITIKLSWFDSHAGELRASRTYEAIDPGVALSNFLKAQESLTGKTYDPTDVTRVAHRIVHGGSDFCHTCRIDCQTAAKLEQLADLAPLHNPPALRAMRQALQILPNAVHVAVFDTAFFQHLPARAFVYPVPYEWFSQWKIRRYGFHGVSHEYCARRAAEMLGTATQRLIICHLGGGCSASAILNGKAIATTMGFTPLEGLMMATRSGSIDPGILPYLLKQQHLSVDQIDEALNRSSGLLGVSGVSSDYREVETAAAHGNPRARLALDIYTDRVLETIGSFAALLGGLDALVFTGGVGEHRHTLRAATCRRLEWMNVRLDQERNANCSPDVDVARPDSPVRVLVIHTREDLMLAQAAAAWSGS